MQKLKINCNFLHYLSLLSAIPDQWKKCLKGDKHQHVLANTQLAINKLTCKTVYNTLICQQQCPPTAEKRLTKCTFDAQRWQSVYGTLCRPFRVTKEVKLSISQYKIIHILYAKNILYKMKKKNLTRYNWHRKIHHIHDE